MRRSDLEALLRAVDREIGAGATLAACSGVLIAAALTAVARWPTDRAELGGWGTVIGVLVVASGAAGGVWMDERSRKRELLRRIRGE